MASHYSLIPTPPGDWKNNVFALQSIRIAAIYNIIIRSMNSIIYHAHKIDETQTLSFMKYSYSVITFIRYHAVIEMFMFNILEVNQSIKSWNEVQVWADLCLDIENQRTKYQPDEFVKIVKETGDAIILHMNYTMPTLNVDSLMERFEPQDLESFEASLAAKHQTERLPFSAAPLMIVNSDCTHNSWFPPVPAPIVLLLRHIVIPLNSSTWQFSQCDTYMKPKKCLDVSEQAQVQRQSPFTMFRFSAGLLILTVIYSMQPLNN